MQLVPVFKDDRGEKRRFSRTSPKQLAQSLKREPSSILQASVPVRRAFAVQAVLVVSWIAVYMAVVWALESRGMGPRSIVVLYGLWLPFMAVWYMFMLPRWHRAYKQSKLAMRICPSCDYDLSGTSADEGAMTVCAECGAVWSNEPDEPQRAASAI